MGSLRGAGKQSVEGAGLWEVSHLFPDDMVQWQTKSQKLV